MTGEIRWLALLPDPVTGLDQPVKAIDGHDMIFVAIDKQAATAQVRAALSANQFRLAAVVSVVDWESRQSLPQRAKLTQEMVCRGANPRQRCFRCGAPTLTPSSRYCLQHTNHGGRPKGRKNSAA